MSKVAQEQFNFGGDQDYPSGSRKFYWDFFFIASNIESIGL